MLRHKCPKTRPGDSPSGLKSPFQLLGGINPTGIALDKIWFICHLVEVQKTKSCECNASCTEYLLSHTHGTKGFKYACLDLCEGRHLSLNLSLSLALPLSEWAFWMFHVLQTSRVVPLGGSAWLVMDSSLIVFTRLIHMTLCGRPLRCHVLDSRSSLS